MVLTLFRVENVFTDFVVIDTEIRTQPKYAKYRFIGAGFDTHANIGVAGRSQITTFFLFFLVE